jgi:putative addiction module component (TIGR02574 family)
MTREQIAAALQNVRSEFAKLPTAERLGLLGDLWDSIAADADTDIPLTNAQKAELDRRLADLEANLNGVEDSNAVCVRLLEKVRSWPEEDQEELAEIVREIEARRTGVYVMTDDERAAIEKALKSPIVPDEDVTAFWKKIGVL